MTPPALLPWKRYLDQLPEPDRSVMIWDLKKYAGNLIEILNLADAPRQVRIQRSR